ncbi:PAS domain S-box-containing protein/diguanylate cyclase (GGDEF) domain-containing protein [Marinobacter daqiaonensis]|uniref:diguanylate cyclase n=1 Tax=Marinobacter daqiaonensis TaxID=650891 RepID=A0A1I6I791_9GAMM|nr:diguanylate cyclase [Marinobacter daqiaonensis]SFR62586.1 PAS domain S-box-containing protein/diguanylate cyclase (GGDEF) domain-containing protein [Marinobacter daqiaonensis]
MASKSATDNLDFSGLFRELASGVPGVLFCYEISADASTHRIPFISSRVRDLFGVSPDELLRDASELFNIIHPDDHDAVGSSIQQSFQDLAPWQQQARLRLRSGEYRWFEGHSVPRREPGGSTLWFGQFTDIQAHKDLEFGLRKSEAEAEYQLSFQQLMTSLSSDFINSTIGDIDDKVQTFLARIGEFFGVDRVYVYRFSEDLARMTNTHEWCREGVPELKGSQQQVDITGFHWWQAQTKSVLKQNRVVFIEDVSKLPKEAVAERELLEEQGVAAMFCVPILIRGVVEGFFGMDSLTVRSWRKDQSDLLILAANLLSEALERHRLEQELLNQSIRDPLTGIHNRRYLQPRVEEMMSRFQRTGEGFALAMLDIDHFKRVNDTLGHQAGDRVLQEFGRLLQEQFRGTDVAARYGGEEFVVALASASHESARQALLRILERVRAMNVEFKGRTVPVTVSAGLVHVVDLRPGKLSTDAMVTEADRRLYKAKRSGRDCLVDASGKSRL